MAKPDRTTTATAATRPTVAPDPVSEPASESVEPFDAFDAEEPAPESPAGTADPLRTTLADGTEYVVRPPKPAPVVGMSRRRREALQRSQMPGRGRADGVVHGTTGAADAARAVPINTEGAGPASVNSSEA